MFVQTLHLTKSAWGKIKSLKVPFGGRASMQHPSNTQSRSIQLRFLILTKICKHMQLQKGKGLHWRVGAPNYMYARSTLIAGGFRVSPLPLLLEFPFLWPIFCPILSSEKNLLFQCIVGVLRNGHTCWHRCILILTGQSSDPIVWVAVWGHWLFSVLSLTTRYIFATIVQGSPPSTCILSWE
jgi:hypothetical protein